MPGRLARVTGLVTWIATVFRKLWSVRSQQNNDQPPAHDVSFKAFPPGEKGDRRPLKRVLAPGPQSHALQTLELPPQRAQSGLGVIGGLSPARRRAMTALGEGFLIFRMQNLTDFLLDTMIPCAKT